MKLLVALAALSCVSALDLSAGAKARELALEQEWSRDLDGWAPGTGGTANPESKQVQYKSPIQRVVALLNKMKAELEHEAAHEAEMYDKMVCWCETNEKEKVKAIADAEAKDKELTAEIQERAARRGVLETEIAQTKKNIAADTESLKQATALREGEAGGFRGGENEKVQAIDNLRNAIAVLSKHHKAASLIQLGSALLTSLRAVLHDVALKYELMQAANGQSTALAKPLEAAFLQVQADPVNRELLSALNTRVVARTVLPLEFAQQQLSEQAKVSPTFLQQTGPTGMKSYNARSGVIFGILKQMLEEFEADLAKSQKDEAKGKEDYEAMAAAKTEQIETAKAKLDEYENEHATNLKALSDAKEDLDLTRKQRSADVKFLRNLRVTCQKLDKEWELRGKTRAEETRAVAETIAILTEDDAADLMRKSVTFIQEGSSTTMQMRRSKAASMLRRAAGQPEFDADDLLAAWRGRRGVTSVTGPRAQLSTLAVTIQLDAFTKVKAMMDKMVADLKKEQEEEVAFRADCLKRLDENEKETFVADDEKEDLEHKMERLENLMKKLTEEIAAHKKEIAETDHAILEASQTREKENSEFQTIVGDQRATVVILNNATNRLKAFYGKKSGGNTRPEDRVEEEQRTLITTPVLAQQTPPVQFNKYKKNAGASPIIGLLEQIIEDSKKLEAEATAAERDAQANYETFVKDSNDVINELNEAITEKTKAKAAADLEKDQAADDHASTVDELERLHQTNQDIHGECDFVLKNFDIRQKARLQEMDAIQAAKGILSGGGGKGGIDKAGEGH